MTIATFKHLASYMGEQVITTSLEPNGSVKLAQVGYYEDDIVIPAETLQALGFVRASLAVKP